MLNEALRRELLDLRVEDRRVRNELAHASELGGPYVRRMEEVHIRNAPRLRALISNGLPPKAGANRVGHVGTSAIGCPGFAGSRRA